MTADERMIVDQNRDGWPFCKEDRYKFFQFQGSFVGIAIGQNWKPAKHVLLEQELTVTPRFTLQIQKYTLLKLSYQGVAAVCKYCTLKNKNMLVASSHRNTRLLIKLTKMSHFNRHYATGDNDEATQHSNSAWWHKRVQWARVFLADETTGKKTVEFP